MGLEPETFWRSTPREIDLIIAGAVQKAHRQHDNMAWAVWHIAYLSTYHPSRPSEFVALDRLTSRKREPKKQDWEQSLSMFESWVKGAEKT